MRRSAARAASIRTNAVIKTKRNWLILEDASGGHRHPWGVSRFRCFWVSTRQRGLAGFEALKRGHCDAEPRYGRNTRSASSSS